MDKVRKYQILSAVSDVIRFWGKKRWKFESNSVEITSVCDIKLEVWVVEVANY